MHWFTHLLPLPELFVSWLPVAWTLPPVVVVKKKKRGWDEEFDHERKVYQQLKALQGDIIPQLYGQVLCDNWKDDASEGDCRDKSGHVCVCQRSEKALVLSDLGTNALSEQILRAFQEPQVENMLRQTFVKMIGARYVQGDCKFDNYHLVGERIFIVDLEKMMFIPDDDDFPPEEYVDDWVRNLMDRWRVYRRSAELDN